ncbi:MAG: hypothetical protein ACYTFT_05745 [Planctomycetota bacterium]|jgi:hypothetical protein
MTHEEAIRLFAESPAALMQLSLQRREDFVFAVRDDRDEPADAWGGELRVCVNQNVVLHLVPGFSEGMSTVDELPQFAVMPSSERVGEDEQRTVAGDEERDLEPFEAVVFWVEPVRYERLVAELVEVAEAFGDPRAVLPDCAYPGARFVELIRERVLGHRVARDERPYDFSKRTF